MRIIRILALILVLVVLVCGALYVRHLEQADNERMRALYTEAEPLERQRDELVAQRDKLPSEYALQYRDYATAEILFPRMDTQIYSEAYPLMREKNIVGVLGISPTEYPTGWNKLTQEEFKALLGDGWGLCMVFENAWSDFNYFFQTIEALCTTYEVPVPTSIYFINNDYNAEMDPILKEHGIKTVIVNASDGRSSTVTDITADLWFTGAMPWSYTGSDIDMELLGRTDGANLTYTMIFNETWKDEKTQKSKETQEEASFKTFLENVKSMMYYESPLDNMEQVASASSIFVDTQNQDQLYELYLQELSPEEQMLLPRFRLANYEQARDFHLKAIENSQEKKSEMDTRQAELDAQIKELDDKIADIYARWNDAGRR